MDFINKYQIAELFLRAFCGVIFLFQGYDKLFKVKISGVTQAFQVNAEKNHVPQFVLKASAVYTSVVEFVCGILLLIGLFKNIALFFLGVDLVIVGIAFSMLEPVWDMRHVFPRVLMVFVLLILPHDWELISIDYLLKIN